MALQAELLLRNLSREMPEVSRVQTNRKFPGVLRCLENVPVVRSGLRFVFFNVSLLAGMKKARVLHIISNSYLSFFLFSVPPLFYARLFKKRSVLNYHGGSADAFLEKFPVVKRIMATADQVVVPSAYLGNVFGKHGIETRIIPNVCDLDRFPFHLREKPVPVLMVARHLEKIYNVECAIRAFSLVKKQHASARLVIAGNGSQRHHLETLVETLDLRQSVNFLGDVRNEDMPAVYEKADIFLNSSEVDNMPVAILEAFASGLPVASTRAGGIPYLVEHGKTGLLTELNDPEALSQSACRLIGEPGLARSLVLNARETLNRYEWKTIRSQWMSVYCQ